MATLIRIEKVTKYYETDSKRVEVLKELSFDIDEELLVILGPSGCGKTTLLKIIAGIDRPSSGKIIYLDRYSKSPPVFGFVFQTPTLIPWISVLENVILPLEARGVDPDEAREIGRRYLSLVGLSSFEDFYPGELSIGMMQRVNLARALAISPDILLMDEPFTALDPLTAENLRAELLDLWISGVTTIRSIVMVTNAVDEAIYMGDRIIVLSPRPARVVANIPIELERPRNRRSEEFQRLEDMVYEYIS